MLELFLDNLTVSIYFMIEYTIIDSFISTEKLVKHPDGLATGCWFIVDGQFSGNEQLPKINQEVIIRRP